MKTYNRSHRAKPEKKAVWKTFLMVLLIGMGAVGMLGCSREEAVEMDSQPEVVLTEETQYEETQIQPTEAQTQPEETKPWETEGGLVTDVYFDDSYTDFFGEPCFYHIPQINLDTPEVEQINQSLYAALYEKLFTPLVLNAPSPQLNGIAYTWTVKDHFLSVISSVRITDGNMLYHYATLVDLDTGKTANLEDILALYDMTVDDYFMAAQIMMDGELVRLNKGLDEDLVDRNFASQLSATLSQENLSAIQPYIDAESGELCIAATLYDIYCQNLGQFRICLTSGEEPVDPFAYRDISQEWDGTEKNPESRSSAIPEGIPNGEAYEPTAVSSSLKYKETPASQTDFTFQNLNVTLSSHYNSTTQEGCNQKGNPVCWSLQMKFDFPEELRNRTNASVFCSWDHIVNGGPTWEKVATWEDAKAGMTYAETGTYVNEPDAFEYTVLLPDDPDIAGPQSITIQVGDAEKTISFILTYLGNYDTGLGWAIDDLKF